MAQLKNMFVKGKMNLDLDERLIPKGEYRKAQNVLITNSEDSDVGAIENVRGNELISDADLNLPAAEARSPKNVLPAASINAGGNTLVSVTDIMLYRLFLIFSSYHTYVVHPS